MAGVAPTFVGLLGSSVVGNKPDSTAVGFGGGQQINGAAIWGPQWGFLVRSLGAIHGADGAVPKAIGEFVVMGQGGGHLFHGGHSPEVLGVRQEGQAVFAEVSAEAKFGHFLGGGVGEFAFGGVDEFAISWLGEVCIAGFVVII